MVANPFVFNVFLGKMKLDTYHEPVVPRHVHVYNKINQNLPSISIKMLSMVLSVVEYFLLFNCL